MVPPDYGATRQEREAARALERLTGFGHATFFQSGTAALEAVVSVLSGGRAAVAVPALACWTVAFAVTKLGRRLTFCDVDEHWSSVVGAAKGVDLSIVVDPWGACADWRGPSGRGGPPPAVADMTLSPGARLDGRPAAAWCEAGVVSLGSGKPLSVGGGGVALFRDPAAAREARRLLRFGFRDGRWSRRVERYVFSHYLFCELTKKMQGLPPPEEAAEGAVRMRDLVASLGLSSNALRPGGRWGHASALPVCLPKGFPLTAREVEGAALASGLRLARHPVSPPYLERAWGRRPGARCPRAEGVASRALFFSVYEAGAGGLGEFFARLLEAPERFRTPFRLSRPRGTLSGDLGRLAAGARLVRNLDGGFGLFEEDFNLLWPLDEREAALVQAAQAGARAPSAAAGRPSGAREPFGRRAPLRAARRRARGDGR